MSVAIALTLIAVGWSSFYLQTGFRGLEAARALTAEAGYLQSDILLCDEALTMSARLCVASGDSIWSERYSRYEKQLDASLRKASELLPGSAMTLETKVANDLLVQREKTGMSLALRGDKAQAQLQFGAEYEKQKASYARGMAGFEQEIAGRADRAWRDAWERLQRLLWISALAWLSLVCLWLALLSKSVGLNRSLRRQNDLLDQQSSELRQANLELSSSREQLVQAQKLEVLATFSASLAHDLNNQLTPVAGHLDHLCAESHTAEQGRSFAAIRAGLQSSSHFLRRMLSMARIHESHRVPLHSQALIAEFQEFMAHTLPSHIRLDVVLKNDLPWIVGSAPDLHSVFLNLVNNARDAMPDGGTIRLVCEQIHEQLSLEVQDQGSGIPPEIQARLFAPFVTTKGGSGIEAPTGTGLGLFSVRRVIEQHGGSVKVTSLPGQGTCVQILLPTTCEPPRPLNKNRRTEGPLRVLIVDDEAAIRRIAQRNLERLGFVVSLAADGLEALEIFQNDSFDLVVSDVTMPGLDGIELARRLLLLRPEVSIILASGLVLEDVPGVTAVLPKPFSSEQLVNAVSQCGLLLPSG